MLSLVYVSSARQEFSHADLFELLKRSRENNTRLGVTGMLLYNDGNFIQVLEGPEEAVRSLYSTIGADARHGGVICLLERSIERREFGDWSMAFRNLSEPEIRNRPGFSEYLNDFSTSLSGNGQTAQRLLHTFRSHLR
ncbi:MAG TPA: BLUF domain-containing protein [Bryobacteraceae bacterium]|nr:BLUF domain-containing protein [Bryobacteraceae bacterium]